MNTFKKRWLVSTAICLAFILPGASWATDQDASAAASATVNANAAADKAKKAADDANAVTEQAKKALDALAHHDDASSKPQPEPQLPLIGIWTFVGVSLFFLISVIVSIIKLRKDPSWKLSDALSEKTDTAIGAPPTPAVASSSRLIAFMGMLAMLSVFMGFGLYMLWALFTGDVTKLDGNVKSAGTYLLYGAALYAPYAFNQIKEAMKG